MALCQNESPPGRRTWGSPSIVLQWKMKPIHQVYRKRTLLNRRGSKLCWFGHNSLTEGFVHPSCVKFSLSKDPLWIWPDAVSTSAITSFSCNNLKLYRTFSPFVSWEVKEFLIQVCQENTFVQVAVDRKQSLNSILIPGSHMHNSKKVDQTIGCCCV